MSVISFLELSYPFSLQRLHFWHDKIAAWLFLRTAMTPVIYIHSLSSRNTAQPYFSSNKKTVGMKFSSKDALSSSEVFSYSRCQWYCLYIAWLQTWVFTAPVHPIALCAQFSYTIMPNLPIHVSCGYKKRVQTKVDRRFFLLSHCRCRL